MSSPDSSYLKRGLYELVKKDERVFDFIQSAASDGLWFADLEYPEEGWMNPCFWTALGYDPSEMPHESAAWQKIVHPEDLERFLQNLAQHCKDPNHPFDPTVRFTHLDGSTVWVRRCGMAIRDENGRAVRMLGANRSITDRRAVDEELEATLNRLQVATEAGGIGIWEYVPGENKLFWDRRMHELFGVPEGRLIRRFEDWRQTVHPDDIAPCEQAFNEMLADDCPFYTEFRVQHPELGLRYLSGDAHVVRDAEGHATHLYGVNRDITERTLAKQERENSLHRLEVATRAGGIGIWEYLPEEKTFFWDQRMHELFGIPPDKFSGKSEDWRQTAHPDDIATGEKAFEDILVHDRPFHMELRVQHPKLGLRYLKADAEVVRDAEGQPTHLIGFDQDITDR